MNQNLIANTIFRHMYATPRIPFRKGVGISQKDLFERGDDS
jgi:hypothetical protein